MITARQSLLAFLGIVSFLGCATLVSAGDDPNQKLSDAREMLRLGQVFPADTMIRDAIEGFSGRQDFRSLGEANLEYANFMQTAYVANAASSSDLEQISLVQSTYIADAAASFEKALPPLLASQDFWSASKVYFKLAVARGRLDETHAACVALSQSLDYYRKALAKDLSPDYFGETASDGSDDGDGMQEVRARFGCDGTQFASSPVNASSRVSSR